MAVYELIRGTFESLWQIGGTAGAQLKSVAGPVLEARDETDAAYIVTRGADPVIDDDFVTKRYGDANYVDAPTGVVRCIRFAIALATVDSATSPPASAIVSRATLNVTTPYSAGTTIAIGDDGGTVDLYMATGENDAEAANLYSKTQETTGVAVAIQATITGAPAAGAGFVSVWYSVPDA